MKPILLILTFFSFINMDIFSQDSCVVKIFPGDCLNCYIGIKKVESSNMEIKKTIIFPKLSQAEIHEYLNNVLGISDLNGFTVIVSDSVYNSLDNNLGSEVYVYDKDKLYDHTLLKTFYGIKEPDTYKIQIPDSIAISQSVTIINNENYFFFTDYEFDKCIFIGKHKSNKINILRGKEFATKSNFDQIANDTLCYAFFSKYRDILKSANMDKMQFVSTFSKRGLMASFILAPNIIEENGGTGMTYKNGVILYTSPEDFNIFGIDEKSLPENYVIYPGFFYHYKEHYYIQIINIDRTKDDQYLVGRFDLENKRLIFSGFPEYKVPGEYLPASKFEHLRKVLSPAGPYLFLQYSLSYFDLDNGQTYHLPFDSVDLRVEFPGQNINALKLEYDYRFIDAIELYKTLQVLYEKSGKYYIAQIDKNNNKLIKNLEITIPMQTIKTWISFYSAEKLFYLTKDNKIIIDKINCK